ncbi:MAG: sensor histidine kinase [Myxococcales bacterium]|nr:HAMP domain-containing histidine kinase [Myxococcales bacterium]
MPDFPRLTVMLPGYDEELITRQRSAVGSAMLLAAPIVVAFTALDRAIAPAAWLFLLVVRVLAAVLLLAIGRAARRSERPERLAFAAVAIVCATIEVCVFATGGVRSPYLTANVLVFAGVGILLPITTRQAVSMYATGLLIALVPFMPGLHPVDRLPLAITASYLLTVAIIGLAGTRQQDNLRRGEHRARLEVARQMGLINLGTLAGGLAHELSSPLTFVGIELEMLETTPLDREGRERVVSARTGLSKMRDILVAMRQGARFANGDLRDVVMHEEVDQALTLVAQRLRSANVTVVREYAPDTPVVSCQPTLLGQVLVNLVLNAIDAMSGRKDARLTLRVRGEGERAVVEIEDNGPGIPDQLRQRIFEPFFSTKGEKGNGLGLWISSEIARVHGGSLKALPCARGALLRLSLPVDPPSAAISAA